MKSRRFLSLLLCIFMGLTLMTACTQSNVGEEEMNRDPGITGEVITTTANAEGSYTVTITEENLMFGETLAEMVPEIVDADEAADAEEMYRDASALGEDADAEETTSGADEPSSEDAAADDAGSESEETSPEDAAKDDAGSGDETWSLAAVKEEDVSVSYKEAKPDPEGEDFLFETLSAEVTGLNNNDDGSLVLSFSGKEGSSESCMYTVHFEGAEPYAVVEVLPPDNGVVIGEIDYEAQEAQAIGDYKPTFSEEDVVLPEGTYVEDGDLIVTEKADETVQEFLLESGLGEEEMSRANGVDQEQEEQKANSDSSGSNVSDATLKYMQEFNERQKEFKNYDAVASYAPEILSYVDPTAGKVAGFGADVYNIFKGVYLNDWGAGIQGSVGILKLFGLFKGPGVGVTNAQILSEVQKVGLEVSDMHSLTKAMNETANITLAELYKERIKTFDTALTALNANAEIAQKMLTQGAILASERGIEAPGEDATAEEEFDYNFDLIEFIQDLENAGGKDARPFKGFTKYMDAVEDNFILVAGEVARAADFNPVAAYDAYWNMYFNFDTQGYYLRKAYRANIEYELKRAFGLIEIYRNVFSPETLYNYLDYNTRLYDALGQLESMPAGNRPEDVSVYDFGGYAEENFRFPVFCNTFGRRVKGIRVVYAETGNNVASGTLEEYVRRLHGRTLKEDLKLAGMWRESNNYGMRFRSNGETDYTNSGHGIGFNAKKEGQWNKADILAHDNGTIYKTHLTYGSMTSFTGIGGSITWRMPYIWFNFS